MTIQEAPQHHDSPRTAPVLLTPYGMQVENAALVTGSVQTLSLEHRVADVLSGRRLDRDALLAPGSFVRAPEWEECRRLAEAALRDGDTSVLVVVTSRCFGSTTFSQHLLAEVTPPEVALCQLDQDWRRPKVSKLPVQSHHAYQLDFNDLEGDRLTPDFLSGLPEYAERLRDAESVLVMTVIQELWTQHHAWSSPGVRIVRLDRPPSARAVVEHHLNVTGKPWLVPYLHSDAASSQLKGLDTAQAMRATGSIIQQWQEFERTDPTAAAAVRASEADQDGPRQDSTDETLRKHIEQALADWQDELDQSFADPASAPRTPTGARRQRVLLLDDRCLLLALAAYRSVSAATIGAASRALQQMIERSGDQEAARGPADLRAAFTGRGFRSRLTDLGATVDSRDMVAFDRPGYSEAVLGYVWDNYEALHDVLLNWLAELPARGRHESHPSVDVLVALALRHRDPAMLEKLRRVCARTGKPDLMESVMSAAVRDGHLGGHAWRMLYDWAQQAPEAQHIVVAVSSGALADRRLPESMHRKAMTRLCRVAGRPADRTTVDGTVLTAFRRLAEQPDTRNRLTGLVRASQQKSDTLGTAGRLAVLALMGVEADGTPWLLSGDPSLADIDLGAALAAVFRARDTQKPSSALASQWLRASADSPELYRVVRERVLALLRQEGSFQTGAAFLGSLCDVHLADGTMVADEIYHELVDPRLRGVFPQEDLYRTA